MLIYKINFFLLIYIFCGRDLKGHAGYRQTEVQTNKQIFCLLRQRIGEQTNKPQPTLILI